ncbi:H-2 class II histocompatibility antigen, A-U alpha chain [Amia ocellicauda]|uniref:H-2 class II histocompatibility antigen, A-U alpha chain n=1 Tax=Amia ocellicauda TaxID=2972642 RepID=UPI0034642F05|nr:HA2K protein [Amia calva]
MKSSLLVLLALMCIVTKAQVLHKDINVITCQTDTTETEDEEQLDGNEIFYVDFNNNKIVLTLPEFADQLQVNPGWIQGAQANKQVCKNNLDVAIQAEKSPPENIDAPQNTIYPRDEVELGKPNTLICFINNFYPAIVKVKWTKNNVEVTEGVTLSNYYPNEDFTFQQFSTLSFTPQLGDVYSCSVEHKALTEPKTRIWEPEVKAESNVGVTAFCGVGLTLGLLGVATGTFFLIKGNNCN